MKKGGLKRKLFASVFVVSCLYTSSFVTYCHLQNYVPQCSCHKRDGLHVGAFGYGQVGKERKIKGRK